MSSSSRWCRTLTSDWRQEAAHESALPSSGPRGNAEGNAYHADQRRETGGVRLDLLGPFLGFAHSRARPLLLPFGAGQCPEAVVVLGLLVVPPRGQHSESFLLSAPPSLQLAENRRLVSRLPPIPCPATFQ